MPTDATSQNSPRPGGGYETRDVNLAGILCFAVCLIIVCVFGDIMVHKIIRHFEARAVQADKAIAQSQVVPSVARSETYFPYPREQPSDSEELKVFRARELGELNSYGWIDQKAGVVRLPIDRAIELLLQRGVPTRSNTNQTTTGPSILQLQQQRAQQPQ